MIRGLFLEGAGWDRKDLCLVEAEPMQMVYAMPTIHFKPVERKKSSKSKSAHPPSLLLLFLVICDVTALLTVRRHVRVSLLLFSRAFGRSRPSVFCGQCGAEVRSCESRPLDQERDRPAHEPGPLRTIWEFQPQRVHRCAPYHQPGSHTVGRRCGWHTPSVNENEIYFIINAGFELVFCSSITFVL